MIRTVAHGLTTLELTGGFGFPRDVEAAYQRLIQAILQHLEEHQH